MKLGEPAEGIYSTSFNVDEKAEGSEYPIADSAILLTYESGDHEWVDYGTARQETTGALEFVDIPKADYFTLTAFLKANLGSIVRFTLDFEAENPWGDLTLLANESYFYATITAYDDGGEAEFSVDDRLYTVKVKLSYVGTTSTSNPNPADTSLKDVCIEIDTVRANASAIVANKAALDAVTSLPGGTIGLTTGDRKVYIYDSSVPEWVFLYTLVADNADYGLVNGVFYLSAFADITSVSTGAESKNWKAGLINERSVKFAASGIDITKGPSIESLEGFSFAMNNVDKFWNFVVSNGISLYNALVKQKFYDRANGIMELHRTGANYNNSFDYHNYTFQVEPEIINNNNSFPDTVFTRENNPNAATQNLGKPIIATFGRWQKGELQISNFTIKEQKFSSERRYLYCTSYVTLDKEIRVNIDYTEFLSLLNISSVGDYPGSNPVKYLYVNIIKQADQPDVGSTRRIESIHNVSSGITGLRLKSAFTVAPNTTTVVQILMSSVELLVDDDAVVGMSKPNYLIREIDSATEITKELFAKIGEDIERVPSGIYQEVDTVNKNRLTINTDILELDNFQSMTINSEVKLPISDYKNYLKILFGTATTSRSIDFGFYAGTFSQIAEGDNTYRQAGFRSHVALAKSKDRFTLSWYNPTGTYASQTIRRYRYEYFKDANNYKLYIDRDYTGIPITQAYFVDDDVALDPKGIYLYRVAFIGSGSTPSTTPDIIILNRDSLPPKDAEGPSLIVREGDKVNAEAILTWNLLLGQSQVDIYRNGILIDTITSSTQTWYVIPFSSGGTKGNAYRIRVFTTGVKDTAVHWYKRDGEALGGNIYTLKGTGETFADWKYNDQMLTDNFRSVNEVGYTLKNFAANNANPLPAFAGVFIWMLKINHGSGQDQIADLSNATDVRLLCNFVVRSNYGNNTQVPIYIQLRGVKRDGSQIVIAQYNDNGTGLVCKQDTKGAFAAFLNLPKSHGGADANYNTEQQTSISNQSDPGCGIYTGKEMWRLPDFLFADNAAEWNQIEYLMFAITNGVAVSATNAASNSPGYKIGLGRLPASHGGGTTFTNVHKDTYLLEYKKKFEGGLDAPQFARIDGGVIDDGAGFYTGTASLIIERARHIANYMVYKMLNYKPKYIGDEMKSRDNWVCRYQTKEAQDVQTVLQLIAKNLWGCFVVSNDDRLILRTLDIEEPKVQTVFAFTDRNIVKDSFTKLEFRKQSEIFQQFKFKYNFEPSVVASEGDKDEEKDKNRSYTEEIVVGWDLVKGKPISGGYSRITEDADGNLIVNTDAGDEGRLTDLCKTSSFLYTSGGKVNQFGYDKDELLEFFYRPTKEATKGDLIEEDLPNLNDLHGPMVRSPKRSVQDRIGKEVRFRVFNAWRGSLKCNLKYILYYNGGDGINSAVNGLKDDAGTPDRKLKLMDKITINHPFFTNGETVAAFVTGIDPDFYNGTATITFYAYTPPGQLAKQIDHRWDAAFGSRNNVDFTFKGNGYGLTNEANTFADASYGSRVNANFKFPDGTAADSEGKGTGKL